MKYIRTSFTVVSKKPLDQETRMKIEDAIIAVLQSEAKEGKLGENPLICIETEIRG